MSLDWTLLLVLDAALLAAAALSLVGLVLRDLRRERDKKKGTA
jgi:hypothetical protein